MKILYFYQYFGTPMGSWSTRVYEFSRRWVSQGNTVTVVTSVYDKSDLKPHSFIQKCQIDGIHVIVINIKISNKHRMLKRLLTFLEYALFSTWYALVLNADVVIASSGPITVGIPGLVAKLVRRVPFVLEVRDLHPEGAIQLGILKGKLGQFLAYKFERFLYSIADQIVVLSSGMAEYIKNRHLLDTCIIPNAADNNLFSGHSADFELPSWASCRNLVLYTGSLGLIDDCIQIMWMAEELQRLKAENIHIVILGGGQQREFLESYSLEKHLSNVHFLGNLPKIQVANWLHHALCSLLVVYPVPVLDTASPNKLFDSLSAGVPVIQTTQGWIKDLLENENCGITVRPRDPHAMASAVLKLACNTELRNEMAKNARRIAVEQFDRDLLSEKMLRILYKTADKS
jgi:glycosyltransferase involved in cell wall biosynthesis